MLTLTAFSVRHLSPSKYTICLYREVEGELVYVLCDSNGTAAQYKAYGLREVED